MADFFEDDEDAKADELPSDEEGDEMTRNKDGNNNNNRKPKTPPPLLDNISIMNDLMDMNQPFQLQQEISNHQSPQSLYAADSFSPRSPKIAIDKSPDIDTSNIMAFNPDTIQPSHRQSKHVPSKTMPVQLPQFWTCQMCTFAENSITSPVCGVCGALPPMENNKRRLKKRKRKKQIPKPSLPQQPIPVPQIPHQQQKPEPPAAFSGNIMNGSYNPLLNDALSPRAYQPSHHQHQLWEQSRPRHNNHQINHLRTVSEQIPKKSFPISQNILPSFLQEEDEKDLQQPSM